MTQTALAPGRRTATSQRHWSGVRVAGGLVLGTWAAMFWFLWLSGRVNLYMSTRTAWVVPVGGILFSFAAIGMLTSARLNRPELFRRGQALVMTLSILPIILVLALPPATLGQFSASRKTSFSSLQFSSIYGQITADGPITLFSVAAAQTVPGASNDLAKRAGSDVDFVGFVVRYADTPADEILLTRYVITCCVADATIVQLRVVNVPPGQFQSNDWVEVKGQIYPLGREVIVNAQSAAKVPAPAKPYLTP
jgi:uncharacterized repeat protein (TIGR03943 family)